MQRLLLVCTASALRPPQVRRRITISAVVVETDATDAVKITIGARTLQRTAGEPLQKALGRLAPKQKKGKKKAAAAAPPPPPLPPHAERPDASAHRRAGITRRLRSSTKGRSSGRAAG